MPHDGDQRALHSLLGLMWPWLKQHAEFSFARFCKHSQLASNTLASSVVYTDLYSLDPGTNQHLWTNTAIQCNSIIYSSSTKLLQRVERDRLNHERPGWFGSLLGQGVGPSGFAKVEERSKWSAVIRVVEHGSGHHGWSEEGSVSCVSACGTVAWWRTRQPQHIIPNSVSGIFDSCWERPWGCPHLKRLIYCINWYPNFEMICKYPCINTVASEPRSFAENSKAWSLAMCWLCLLLSIPCCGVGLNLQGRNRRLLIAAEDTQRRGAAVMEHRAIWCNLYAFDCIWTFMQHWMGEFTWHSKDILYRLYTIQYTILQHVGISWCRIFIPSTAFSLSMYISCCSMSRQVQCI